ncbi:MAG: MBL fold metallo-hydrolase [Mogibacterium sp.]|nr:MBL fold metallo-hydrolase [Mogibacterium sp.]
MIRIYRSDRNSMGENTYLIQDQATGETAVIDPGCCPKDFCERIRQTGGLRYILLTHGHADHLISVPEFKEKFPEAEIVAGFDEKEMLSDCRINGSRNMYRRELAFDADQYVIDGEELKLGETTLKFLTTPGHTKGGVCIYAGGALFSGDTLFYRSIGRTDLYGGDFEAIQMSIQNKLYVLPDDTVVYPGHGPETTIGREKLYNPYV